jgi:hypothetical protein
VLALNDLPAGSLSIRTATMLAIDHEAGNSVGGAWYFDGTMNPGTNARQCHVFGHPAVKVGRRRLTPLRLQIHLAWS